MTGTAKHQQSSKYITQKLYFQDQHSQSLTLIYNTQHKIVLPGLALPIINNHLIIQHEVDFPRMGLLIINNHINKQPKVDLPGPALAIINNHLNTA